MVNLKELERDAKVWLNKELKKSRIVFEKQTIPSEIYNYLKTKSLIADLTKQYVFIKSEYDNEINAFRNNFWLIIFQYLNLAFDNNWYLTGHYAYKFMVEDFSLASKQLTISTQAKSNRMLSLLDGVQILASYDKDFESKPLISKSFFDEKIELLKPEYLLINSSKNDYHNYKSELISIIKSSERDEAYIVNYFTENSSPVLLTRLIGALRDLEDFTLRIELEELLKLSGTQIKIESPFDSFILLESSERPAYLARFEISMTKAIETLSKLKKPKRLSKRFTVEDLDAIVIDETYHSLTIEGYTVTRALIEFLQNEESLNNASELRDQLAAKGFMNALAYIRKLITAKFVIHENLAKKLFEELWKPSINAGSINTKFDIYRKHMVAIKGAQYVPPSHEKVPYMIDEVFDYARKITNGFELAIFLHYFYVGVHPHADGNGRISRFLMNLALIQDKYHWLTIPSEDRKNYFGALERSQLEDDISYFAEYIVSQY